MALYEVNVDVRKRYIYRVDASSYEDAAEIAREKVSEVQSLDVLDEVNVRDIVKLDGTEDCL